MQSKKLSTIEQLTRISITYICSVYSYRFIFDNENFISDLPNYIKGLYFVVLSFIVGYSIRRIFNGFKK